MLSAASPARPRPNPIWGDHVHDWRDEADEARREFAAPVAEVPGECPMTVCTTRRVQHLKPVPTGRPDPVDHLVLRYRDDRMAVSARASSDFLGFEMSPARMVFFSYEIYFDTAVSDLPSRAYALCEPAPGPALVVDGVERPTWFCVREDGLWARTAIIDEIYYCLICREHDLGRLALALR
jgi:hypothetical protein